MGVKIHLPKDWRAVSIGQFQEITGIASNRIFDQMQKDAAVLEVLSGIKAADLLALPFSEFLKLVKATAWLADPPQETKLKAWKPDPFTRYTAFTDARQITAGDFITLQELTGQGIISNMPQILALLTRKEELTWRGWKPVELTPAEFEARAKLFSDRMPVSFAYPVALFFSTVLNAFSELTLASLAKKKERMIMMQKRAKKAAADGDGSD